MNTELQHRTTRAKAHVARLEAPDLTRAEEAELVRQLVQDARWLRVSFISLIRAPRQPEAYNPAASYECCGRTFHSLQAYKGHRNSKFHRSQK